MTTLDIQICQYSKSNPTNYSYNIFSNVLELELELELKLESLTWGDDELRLSSVVFTLNPDVDPAVVVLSVVEVVVVVVAIGSSRMSSSVLMTGAGSTTIEGLVVLLGNSGFECCLCIQ